jgi:membrane-associated phospholipid phosphatase
MPKTSRALFASCTLATFTCLCAGSTAIAQTAPDTPSPVAAQADPLGAVAFPVPSLSRVLKDTVIDFRHLPSRQSITWLTVGTAASFLGHSEDLRATKGLAQPGLEDTFESGSVIGGLPFQLGGAFATYTLGRVTNNPRLVNVGAELVRAQTVAQTMAWAMKYSIRRTRPDGSSFSFPSGHASVSFASATVLQRNFGWKVGIPAYSVASYVAASRIQMKRHYLSDVAFGAAVGVLAGRTVTVGRGRARLFVSPLAAPGGGGIAFSLLK